VDTAGLEGRDLKGTVGSLNGVKDIVISYTMLAKQIKRREALKKAKAAAAAEKTNLNVLTQEYKNKICENSYIGKKGYTIPREHLTPEDIGFLHENLHVKAESFGPKYGAPTDEVSFPVYRENAKKIYIPRFYGIERYGLPTRSDLETGDPISVEFVKELRDYQDKIIDVYMKHVTGDQNGSGGILEVPCGKGKCLAFNTPVLMYDGCIKPVQDVIVGDLLMGDDSTPRRVLSLARGRERMYNISSIHGDRYTVNESHILSLKYEFSEDVRDISVKDYLNLPKLYYLGSRGRLMGYRVPVDFPEKEITGPDPYQMGFTYSGVLSNEYKCNSREIRLQVLAGILDKMGEYKTTFYNIDITQLDKDAVDIVYLARSLGYSIRKNNYCIKIYGAAIDDIPVQVIDRIRKQNIAGLNKNGLKYQIVVEPATEDQQYPPETQNDYYGFEIDGNRRFVLGDFTVTHNTVMALKIISLLQKKTLIIVHKEFLMNQWIERAAEFIPSAKIGKIQGPIFDIQGKDVVIGMLQTLYDREFPEGAFDCFGLTIVDEVHRIGSEQFSKTLLRTITRNMLGISATVDRKDGLTRVLHMFIGPKIYSEERKSDDPVCVRAIEYISADPEFNEILYDQRGNPKYSTMISKLCDFGPRSDFIVRVLGDLIKENDEKQIMVLGHNRSLLKYLHEAIVYRGFATVGYYVGGMKQVDLQKTEEKQIVLATYAMAAEALDIKTLSTLVMVTPKTDIVQSVGRILRVKHDNPIIVDIVDRHDLFQNQFKQRKTFYRKCNYRIVSMDSVRYNGFPEDYMKSWTKVFEPKATYALESEPKEHKCLIKFDSLDSD
jgi:superfamily II DNA or RNA helicase